MKRLSDLLEGIGCAHCGFDGWVCENHPELPQGHSEDCGGAGDPCPECNPLSESAGS